MPISDDVHRLDVVALAVVADDADTLEASEDQADAERYRRAPSRSHARTPLNQIDMTTMAATLRSRDRDSVTLVAEAHDDDPMVTTLMANSQPVLRRLKVCDVARHRLIVVHLLLSEEVDEEPLEVTDA